MDVQISSLSGERSVDEGQVQNRAKVPGLSYKFQRLRERLRAAVASGELTGKLPGERALARRFKVNAKTLSKALTDLAAEGLLDRSIGRGTYVKGSVPADEAPERWLVLCDVDQTASRLVGELLRLKPHSRAVAGTTELRPSFLSQFSAVIDCARATPERFRRDMIVRGIPVVAANDTQGSYSTAAVYFDTSLAVFSLTRQLLLGGHRRLGIVEQQGQSVVLAAARQAANRYSPDAVVEAGDINDLPALQEHGITALICDGQAIADAVMAMLSDRDIQVPAAVSVAAVGSAEHEPVCSGYYVDPLQKASVVVELVKELQPHRPSVLWLSGQFVDRQTMGVVTLAELGEMSLKLPTTLAS